MTMCVVLIISDGWILVISNHSKCNVLAGINTAHVQYSDIHFLSSSRTQTYTQTHTCLQLLWCPVCCMHLGVCPLESTICSFLFIASIPSCALSFWCPPPPCQSGHQLQSYALHFSLLSGTHYVIFS